MAGKAVAYRREAHAVLAELGEAELRVARDFLEFLRLKEKGDPTLEILENRGMMRDIRAAREDLRRGRRSKLVPWDRVKRDV
jgi:hypothetical protein